MENPDVSLLIPTYNENAIIAEALHTIARQMPPNLVSRTEILIVDDGKDALPETVAQVAPALPFESVKVLRNDPPRGKCRSLADGFEKARGEIVGFLDADLSTPPSYIEQAVAALQSGETDIFIGSRWAPGAQVTREQSWIKDVLGDGLGVIARAIIFFGQPQYRDTQCGFKFFKNKTAKLLYRDLCAPDGLGDLEVLLRANLIGLRVKEQGVKWSDVRESKRALRRILIGELKAMTKILWFYKLGAGRQRRLLQRRAADDKLLR